MSRPGATSSPAPPRPLPALGGRTGSLVGLLLTLAIPGCSSPENQFDPPPDIVLIAIDTLRADHLTSYGYRHDTAPEIDRLFGREGTLFEHAYSQAAWTSPSVASYLTGLDPQRLDRGDLDSFGIPKGIPTLAGRLRGAGYSTAGFVANPLLMQQNGFARGFDEYHRRKAVEGAMTEHAEAVLDPALEWLSRARRSETPFFLYVHFLDPHDPYESPDVVDNRSPFDGRGSSRVRGDQVQAIYAGDLRPKRPRLAARHLAALYDSEIHYVDRAVGRLVGAVENSSGDRPALFALVADHGEEFLEHGGWKHGHTLYEEMIHVPMMFRRTESVAPGRRIRGEVALLDIAPTLLDAAGLKPRGLDGVSHWPLLLGEVRNPPRRAIYSRHWHFGPMRAALVLDRRKTILFNSRESAVLSRPLRRHLAEINRLRLPRAASFDLERDPREQEPLDPSPEHALEILRRLDESLTGIRVLVRTGPGNAALSGKLTWEATPDSLVPLFLSENDEVEIDGTGVRFRLAADPLPRGFVLGGHTGALVAAELARTDGAPAPEILLGPGEPWTGREVPLENLMAPTGPDPGGSPALLIWNREPRPTGNESPDEETERTLRALGYIG